VRAIAIPRRRGGGGRGVISDFGNGKARFGRVRSTGSAGISAGDRPLLERINLLRSNRPRLAASGRGCGFSAIEMND